MSDLQTEQLSRWGVSHFQWGFIMNMSLILVLLSLFEWETARLWIGGIASITAGIGFWMFLDTLRPDGYGRPAHDNGD